MASNGHSSHHRVEVMELSTGEISQDLTSRVTNPGPGSRRALIVTGAIMGVGILGIILRILGGFEDRSAWGYYAAIIGWLISTAGAAPLAAFAFRMTKAHWRKPMVRAAELWGAATVFIFLMLIPLYFTLPSTKIGPDEFRPSVWYHATWGAPHVWNALGMLGFVVAAVGFMWAAGLPDLAAVRDRIPGNSLARRLSGNWNGSHRNWLMQEIGLLLFGAFFMMMLITANFLIPADFALALVPGWKDAIFPAYHAVTALQGGLATVIVTMYVMRRWGGLGDYIKVDPFWAISKPLLALSLMWFYFWWSGFIIFWYGRLDGEIGVLKYVQFETYRVPFFAAMVLCFLVPLLGFIWNSVRKSIIGPTLVSLSIIVGLLIDRIRIYVSAMGVPDDLVGSHAFDFDNLPAFVYPDFIDALLLVGALGGIAFFYLLATRILPPVSIWETKEDLLLRVVRPVLRGTYAVIGKPR